MVVAEERAQVVNPLGLHARPASAFVKLANTFRSDVSVSKDAMTVNGKSIMGVMTLAAECGSELIIRAEGDDAPEAVRALAELVRQTFAQMDHDQMGREVEE